MKTDTSRMFGSGLPSKDHPSEIYLYEAVARMKFEAVQPFSFRLLAKTERGTNVALPHPAGLALIARLSPKLPPIVMQIGLSKADAEARIARLQQPNRPDGFHCWN